MSCSMGISVMLAEQHVPKNHNERTRGISATMRPTLRYLESSHAGINGPSTAERIARVNQTIAVTYAYYTTHVT